MASWGFEPDVCPAGSVFPSVSGIILAGGKGRFMFGEVKALWPIGGETMLERQIRLMRPWCREIVVATDTPRLFLPIVPRDVRIVTDYAPGRGPLGGMAAGLSLAQSRYAWIVDSGMPDPSAAAARVLLARCAAGGWDAAWPSDAGGPYPLHGVYDCACAGKIVRMAEQGTPGLSDLPNRLAWAEVTETEFAQMGIGLRFTRSARSPCDLLHSGHAAGELI